jgi:spore coat protein H
MKTIPMIIIVLISTMLSCKKYGEINDILEQSDIPDWTESTHGNISEPDYSTVFNQDQVLRFDIKISEENWLKMQEDLDNNLSSPNRPGAGFSEYEPVWVPCSFFFNGIEWYKVGIRYKGNSSLQSTYRMGIKKFSFKLDFDQFEDDYPVIKNQRFYGFKQLNLKNNFEDASHMREKVASDLFRTFGIVSPQTAFCVIYIDYGSGPQYFGVYTLVEEVDDTVLDNQFGNENGNLYKPDGDAASFAAGTYNQGEMEKKNNEDSADYTDVYDLYTALNDPIRSTNTEQWRSVLGKCLDINVFLKWLAANTAMQNWDTYGKMTHNYYLYNNPENKLLTWIPWDNNEALEEGKQDGALSLELNETGSDWPLIRYLIDVPEYKILYQVYLEDFIVGSFGSDRMVALYANYYNLLKDYVYQEISGYTFLSSDNEFDIAVEKLKNHVQERKTAIENYLNQ